MGTWTLYGFIDQLLDSNPLYSIFNGSYALAIVTAVALFIGVLVAFARSEENVAYSLVVVMLCMVWGAAGLSNHDSGWGTPTVMFVLTAGLLVCACIVANGPFVTGLVKCVQITTTLLVASVAATCASEGMGNLYGYTDPTGLSWRSITDYMWGSDLLLMVIVAGLCIAAILLYHWRKNSVRPSTRRNDQTGSGTGVHVEF
jgi:hypothetical protein